MHLTKYNLWQVIIFYIFRHCGAVLWEVFSLQARCGPEGGYRDIALHFHDRGTRRGWVVSSTPRAHFTLGKPRDPFYRRLGGPQGQSGRAEYLVPTGIRSRTVQTGNSVAIPTELPGPQELILVINSILLSTFFVDVFIIAIRTVRVT